jgi:hypothetical protein
MCFSCTGNQYVDSTNVIWKTIIPNPTNRPIEEDRRQPAQHGSDRRAIPRHNPDGVLNEIYSRLRKSNEYAHNAKQIRAEAYWAEYGIVPPVE